MFLLRFQCQRDNGVDRVIWPRDTLHGNSHSSLRDIIRENCQTNGAAALHDGENGFRARLQISSDRGLRNLRVVVKKRTSPKLGRQWAQYNAALGNSSPAISHSKLVASRLWWACCL